MEIKLFKNEKLYKKDFKWNFLKIGERKICIYLILVKEYLRNLFLKG